MPGPRFTRSTEPATYAVIFSSVRTSGGEGYEAMAARMLELASRQPGFLGVESARSGDGTGITVSTWASLEAIQAWRDHPEHREAQRLGLERWYERCQLRVARIERVHAWARPGGASPSSPDPGRP